MKIPRLDLFHKKYLAYNPSRYRVFSSERVDEGGQLNY